MMGRAFVNEDNLVEEIPDRLISGHPNYVTPHGLARIDSALAIARREYGEAQASGNREGLAKSGRDLRYWSARRASAQLVTTDPDEDYVQFGSAVTITRDGGHRACHDLQARTVSRDELAPLARLQPVAQDRHGCKVHKRSRDRQIASSTRCRLTPPCHQDSAIAPQVLYWSKSESRRSKEASSFPRFSQT
jgi:transcription elongation GreA/GreB family factor